MLLVGIGKKGRILSVIGKRPTAVIDDAGGCRKVGKVAKPKPLEGCAAAHRHGRSPCLLAHSICGSPHTVQSMAYGVQTMLAPVQ